MSEDPKAIGKLKSCGLYRTTMALAGKEELVPAGRLVYFHNHSEQGSSIVLMPASNDDNKWSFHTRGYLVGDKEFEDSLAPLPREGFYVLRANLTMGEGMMPERSLVQLGYNPKGEAILFPGQRKGNSISFPKKGAGFKSDDVFKELDPVGFIIQSDSSAKEKDPKKTAPKGPPTLH
jgi:hypothetical protein